MNKIFSFLHYFPFDFFPPLISCGLGFPFKAVKEETRTSLPLLFRPIFIFIPCQNLFHEK